MIQHHVKYEELHGEDKIVMMDYGEHKRLHARLRKEGKCDIPAEELHNIAHAAYRRTEKGKAIERRRVRPSIAFSKNVDTNISLIERIRFNIKADSINVYSTFKGCEGRKIIRIDID